MELDELANMNKSEFLPMIKQEQVDAVMMDAISPNDKLSEQDLSGSSGTLNSAFAIANPCDSVEKRSESATPSSSKCALLKCVWCTHQMGINEKPKLLECLHVACAQCITTKISELDRSLPQLIHCPVCDCPSHNDYIIENQFLMEQCLSGETNAATGGCSPSADGVKAVPAPIHCSSDGDIATSWCVECSEYICDNCVQAHSRLKITKDHTIKPKDEVNGEQILGAAGVDKLHMCLLHPQEKLSLFCETCDKLTCRDCQLSDHRDHKYKFAHEIATETREMLATLVSEINYKRFLLTSATKVIEDRQQLIQDKKRDLIAEITNMVVKITNAVNTRGKQLAMILNEVCDSKLKVLIEKKDTLQMLSDNTDHCIEFMDFALDKGSDYAILSSKKSMMRHLQKLKSQRADIPNPEIPVRIQVQLNHIPELQKVLSQVGTIMVDGKPFPPVPTPINPPPRQQISPNMAPPLRPGLPPILSPGIPPNGHSAGFVQNNPPIYNNGSGQQYNNMNLGRPFQDGTVRFSNMPTVGMPRQGQPHVSSSTHPHNMEVNLRGLLNNPTSQSPNPPHLQFNGPPSYPGGPGGAQSPHQQMVPQIRPHFMACPPNQQHHGFSQNSPGTNNNSSFLGNNARFQNFQRMSNHAQHQAAAAAMANNVNQIASSNALQRSQIMGNNMIFHANQGGFNGCPTQSSPQLGGSMTNMAKWHIPQSGQQPNASQQIIQQQSQQQGPMLQFSNGRPTENFKISLKSPNTLKNSVSAANNPLVHNLPAGGSGSINPIINAASFGLGPAVSILPNVSSTNPKTPSPCIQENSKDFTEPIDKVRDDSINDLMATIAKLDSNGVQVLPEGRTKTTSPQVHSSTDLAQPQEADNENDQKDDPNEDWCAVCLDGGELMCCDKCPKVFHQNCHIPAISSLPDESESWQCLLCVDLRELAKNEDNHQKAPGELSRLELMILQRICLELYCQYEQSLNFRESESPANTGYYEIITNPMSLDVIRTRLDPSSPNHYKEIAGFIADVRLIFKNTYLFYQEDTKTYLNAKFLENFFEEQLAKWLPQFNKISKNNAHFALAASPGLSVHMKVASPQDNGRRSSGNADDASCSSAKRQRKALE